jgi:hypothetical protein
MNLVLLSVGRKSVTRRHREATRSLNHLIYKIPHCLISS